MNKKVDFELFVELLSDHVDPQRVYLDIDHVLQRSFSKEGLPHLVLSIFSALTGITLSEML